MAKRSDFKRRKNDAYYTPIDPVRKLIPHLPEIFDFTEPCAGDGRLIRHMLELASDRGMCIQAFDIEPKCESVEYGDALTEEVDRGSDLIITNPPWTRSILHPLIDRFAGIKPTWLLFDADWMHTRQAKPYLDYCVKVVSVGRVKWIEDSKHMGKDNSAWYLFDKRHSGGPKFHGLD